MFLLFLSLLETSSDALSMSVFLSSLTREGTSRLRAALRRAPLTLISDLISLSKYSTVGRCEEGRGQGHRGIITPGSEEVKSPILFSPINSSVPQFLSPLPLN